jgi:hypothetical protein
MHILDTKGTFWAHLCPRTKTLPLVDMREDAGRPACFADGSTVRRGAPKGIRNLTCGFQQGTVRLTEYRIVAGQAACGSQPALPRLSPIQAASRRFLRARHANGTRPGSRADVEPRASQPAASHASRVDPGCQSPLLKVRLQCRSHVDVIRRSRGPSGGQVGATRSRHKTKETEHDASERACLCSTHKPSTTTR